LGQHSVLFRRPHPRRGRAAAPMACRHPPQPAGPGARKTPPRTQPPRRRFAIGRADGTRAAISFAAGQAAGGVASTLAVALAKEVLGSMLLHNLKVIARRLRRSLPSGPRRPSRIASNSCSTKTGTAVYRAMNRRNGRATSTSSTSSVWPRLGQSSARHTSSWHEHDAHSARLASIRARASG
jgi:hypothetical protein